MAAVIQSMDHLRGWRWALLETRSSLSHEQAEQLRAQFEAHRHLRYAVDLDVGVQLPGFVVHPGIMRPESMSSRWLAEYLVRHPDLLAQRTVLDMGCGSGIQGTVAALSGAKGVVFADVSAPAIANTRENVLRFGLQDRSETCEPGDLFDQVASPADVIIFNHPFFPADPIDELPISRAMMDPGRLIHRFFEQATHFCRGLILMPFFHLAGEVNDPGIQAPLHGYRIARQYRFEVHEGLQQGAFSIYEISL
jgi:methylase of polypeptide subunit release factors